MKYKLILLLIGILYSSFSVGQSKTDKASITIENKFDDHSVSWFKNKGQGSIKGTARFKSKNGELRFGEVFRIELMPFCRYTQERLGNIYRDKNSGYIYVEDGVPKFTPDPEGYHDTIKTFCNSQGEFVFDNLPAGEYYVIAFMLWDENSIKTGGGIMQRLILAEGETKLVSMTNER